MGRLFIDNKRDNMNKKRDKDLGEKAAAIEYRVERAQIIDLKPMLDLWSITPGLRGGASDEESKLKVFMERNPSTSLLLRTQDGLIGTVLGGFDGRRGYIYHLAVHPDYQRKGCGKVLLNQVISELKQLGALKIHLFAFNDNQAALGFYHHQGWELRQDIEVFSWDAGNTDNKK